MRLIEWEVAEDGYEEQIIIPKGKRELAAEEPVVFWPTGRFGIWA